MEEIFKFCEGAERVFCSTQRINNLKDLTLKINPEKDEIYRSRWCKNGSCIFNMELKLKDGETLHDQIKYMESIEQFYNNKFSWRFNGKNIEIIAYIPMTIDNMGIFTRYKSIYGFIKQLRKRLIEILKFREYMTEYNNYNIIQDIILSTGSINKNTGCYVTNINPYDSATTIMNKSNKKILETKLLKHLDMRFWVKEINPDFFKQFNRTINTAKKYPLTPEIFNKYPPCIKKLASLKKKGNINRFLLATFFLKIHNERDAKYQLDTVLDDNERHHMNHGNCKDQWRAIITKEYSAPSCKTMIDNGFCEKNCGKAAPIDLEGG